MDKYEWFYNMYIFSLMIIFNLLFLLFVHDKHDFSVNIVLFLFTLPIIIIQLQKIFYNDKKNILKKQRGKNE